ncbi:MAG TPA: glycosyltransferase family 2 protein [Candidatus Dormibacteraeota bacterium]|nr:glycosyltransferase family 2 protein [Candidatus Dormibacteraeota bacterium]
MGGGRRSLSPLPNGRAGRLLSFLVRLLLVLGAVVALLPFFALGRGLVEAVEDGLARDEPIGVAFSLVALMLGALFFLYAVRYYLATLVMLLSSLVLGGGNGNGNHRNGGNGRFLRRRNGNGANGNGNGGKIDLGYEPFVSIHIATYNERRVIGRLLEGCAALDYSNYEVIVVDDSNDETAAILEAWQVRPRFKVIRRPSRDGFKGGALAVALRNTDPRAEFVVVWDADVVPFADSIQTFLPHFFQAGGGGVFEPRADVAAVQSYQWHVLNRSESWLTEAVRAEYAGSYMVERPFQEFVGSLKMIAGTAYMIRAAILREVGWGRSLTEDWELTLRLHLLGYKVVYTPYAESPAECVATFGRLARQRMRWAEGHTHNVRKWWREVMRSPHLSAIEKVEFLYYSTYYLQAAFFTAGSTAWLLAEIALRSHLPDWTSAFGWALLISNMLALPLMNFAGLLLEAAPGRDFVGVLGALVTSFLLVPFQTYAALKGLFERDEGPWYRTPKTGRVTDPIHRLRRLKWLRRWLGGTMDTPRARGESHAASRLPGPRVNRRGWLVAGAMAGVVGALVMGAVNAPTAEAAGSTLFLHGASTFTMDTTTPTAVLPATFLLAPVNATRTWATTTSTTNAQTIFASTSFTFQYWTTGVGGTTGVTLTFAFSSSSTCSSPTTIAQLGTTLSAGSGLTTPSFSPASDVTVPAGSFFCFTLTVTALGVVNLTLDYDAASSATNLASTQTIFIPELVLPLLGLALLAPAAARRRWR